MRQPIRIFGYNLKWIVLAVFYPFVCWALYQDTKAKLPWYYIALACVLGAIFGVLLIRKIIEPAMNYCDNKIAKLLRIKE